MIVINMVVTAVVGVTVGGDLLRHQRKIKFSSLWFLCISVSQFFEICTAFRVTCTFGNLVRPVGPLPRKMHVRQSFA